MSSKLKYIIIGIFVVGIIVLISLGAYVGKLVKDVNNYEYNLSVKNNKIIKLERRNNDLIYTTKAYKANKKELKKYNDSLYRELKKIKGDVITLNHIVFGLKQDTSDLNKYIDTLKSKAIQPTKTDSNEWAIDWVLFYNYGNNNFDRYKGETTIEAYSKNDIISIIHKKTKLLERTTNINLVWGQKYTKDGVQVYVKTEHPSLSVQNMDGVFVKYPKKKHWFTGFGIGPSLSGGYDVINNRTSFIIGVGINYNIYQW